MVRLLITLISILFVFFSCRGQKTSIDITTSPYLQKPRTIEYPFHNIYSYGHISVSYSQKLYSKFDFIIGIGRMSGKEIYFKNEFDFTENQIIHEDYSSCYLSINLGSKYWYNNDRKGFYLKSIITPHFLILSEHNLVVNENLKRFKIENNGKESFNDFNFSWNTGAGYEFCIYKSFLAYLGFDTSVLLNSYEKNNSDGPNLTIVVNMGLSISL